MDVPDPTWLQPLIWVCTAIGAGGGALFVGFRKSKPDDRDAAGTAQVIAASFVDRTSMAQMIDALVQVKDELIELNGHMHNEAQYRHDERVAKEATMRALMEARLSGKS